MRYKEDPHQAELFDAFQSILSPLAHSKLQHGWQHLFRCAILKLLPAKTLGEHFSSAQVEASVIVSPGSSNSTMASLSAGSGSSWRSGR